MIPARSAPATPASARSSSAAWSSARSATRASGSRGSPSTPARATIPNESGRVKDPDSGEQVPGHYVVGWIKRGPSGVIGTNKKDAADTVAAILEDLASGKIEQLPATSSASPPGVPGSGEGRALLSIEELLDERGGDHVTYMGWQAIDRAERAAGEPHGRPRVKFCRVHEMVEASRSSSPAVG